MTQLFHMSETTDSPRQWPMLTCSGATPLNGTELLWITSHHGTLYNSHQAVLFARQSAEEQSHFSNDVSYGAPSILLMYVASWCLEAPL